MKSRVAVNLSRRIRRAAKHVQFQSLAIICPSTTKAAMVAAKSKVWLIIEIIFSPLELLAPGRYYRSKAGCSGSSKLVQKADQL